MAKKKAKTSMTSAPPLPGGGSYGPECGSPQNVQFGKFTELSFLGASQRRAEEVEKIRHAWDNIATKTKTMAEYQGGMTTCFKKDFEKPKY